MKGILDKFRRLTSSTPSAPVRSVTVEEELPRNLYREVTDADREVYKAIHGTEMPNSVKRLQVTNQLGQKVQVHYKSPHRFEGDHLVRAVRRAERWLRSNQDSQGVIRRSPPRHIALAISARNAILDHGATANG